MSSSSFLNELTPPTSPTLTVSELNFSVKRALDTAFSNINVAGEIANFSRPMSGHIYFTLKDSNSELRCVLFKTRQMTDYITLLKDGVAVELTGNITLYTQRGQYQMIATSVRLQGEGLLKKQFLALKARLESQGLFAIEHKKNLPLYPKTIGVISAPSAAGLQDFLTILKTRYPVCQVLIFPAPVQGAQAAAHLIEALQQADQYPGIDTIIFCRGGGSLEDMWCFNDEGLAQAIFQCKTPIISAIGHERDFSICDYCADVRAATPTNAAMLVAPDIRDTAQQFSHMRTRVSDLVKHVLYNKKQLFLKVSTRIQHPLTRIQKDQALVERLTQQLIRQFEKVTHRAQRDLHASFHRLQPALLQHYHQRAHFQLLRTQERLLPAAIYLVHQSQSRWQTVHAQLASLNPTLVLKRGYAVIKSKNQWVTSKSQLKSGDRLTLCLHDGSVDATIS